LPVIRQLGLGLAAGLLSALLFLSVVKGIAFGFVLSYVAPLPVMMAGLGVGIGASVTAGLVGMVVVTLGFGEISALSYLVAAALPSWVVCNRAMMWRQPQDGPTEWYPPGLVLAWLTATILGLIMIGAFLVTGHPEGIAPWTFCPPNCRRNSGRRWQGGGPRSSPPWCPHHGW